MESAVESSGEGHRGRRACAPHRRPLAARRRALQRRPAPRRRPGHRGPLQVRSAQLRRLRREAGVRRRPVAAADRLPRHRARGDGLRGHVDGAGQPAPGPAGRRDPPRHQRLAVRDRQDRNPLRARLSPGRRHRPAAALRQPGRRPGRARLRRRLLRRGAQPRPRLPRPLLAAGGQRHPLAEGAGRLALRGSGRAPGRRRRGDLSGDAAGSSRLRRQERLPRRRHRHVRRDRQRAVGRRSRSMRWVPSGCGW